MSLARLLIAPVVLLLLSLVPGLVPTAGAQEGPLCPVGCGVPYGVEVTPDNFPAFNKAVGQGGSVTFTVRNVGDNTDTYFFDCFATGPLTCGTVTPGSVTLGTFTQTTVTVNYTTGATAGAAILQLEAAGQSNDVGSRNITVVAPPLIALVAPVLSTGSRAVVRTRQPVVRALFTTGGSGVDSTPTLVWDGQTVTSMTNQVRRSRGLLEWEVDSTRWLAIGDSAQVSVTACAKTVACASVSRWVVLENDQKPVLGFTGMPLGALGSQFTAPFGPGLSVSGAEVETGFSTPAYYSMGVARSFGMSYSTRQSYPRALVPVDLELPWPTGTPDQIKLVLIDGAVRLDSLVLTNPTCATGAIKRCRAVLQGDFSASTFAVPTRKWLKVEASVTDVGTTKMGTDSTEVVIVDRRGTIYGNGWWPSMLLKLVQAGNDRVLIGSTGAATVFRGNGDSLYLPPPGNFSALKKTTSGWELQPRASKAKLIFDVSGRLQKSVDQNGNRDSLAYSGSTDQLVKRVDPVGKETTFTFGANGRLWKILDPAGRESRVSITNVQNWLQFDSLPSPTTKPARTDYVYHTYAINGTTYTLALTKRIGVILDTTIVTYDSTFKRRPKQVRLPRVNDETGAIVTPVIGYVAYERQGYGALRSLDSVYVELKDPRNNWTRSLLNRWAQSRRSWDSLGLLSRTQYHPDGAVQWAEGKVADSSRVYHAYDNLGRLVKTYIIRAAGDTMRVDSLAYDTQHRVVKRIDSRGEVDSLTYDANGNVIASRDPAGNVTRTWYRTDGLVDSMRVPGNTVSREFAYDGVWRNLAQVFNETGDQVTTNTFDAAGRQITAARKLRVQVTGGTTQMQWRRTTTYYNLLNQVDSTVLQRTANCADPCNTPTWQPVSDTNYTRRVGHRFDRAGRDSLRLNDRGKATMYLHDRLGRLLSRRPWTDSMAVKDSMVYDIAGNLVKIVTRRGDLITSAYDSRSRDTSTVIPGLGTVKRVFGGPLDQLSRLYHASPVDSIGGINPELRWRYDKRGRLKADTSYTGATVRATTYSYDAHERPSTMTDPLGTWTTRYEAERGYPTVLVTPFADSLVYTYDDQDRAIGPTIMSSGPSVHRKPTWLQSGIMDTLQSKVNTPTSWKAGEYSRVFDLLNDPVPLAPVWKEQTGSGTVTVSRQDTAAYDGWERVVGWQQLKGAVPIASEAVTYDRSGNVRSADQEIYDVTTERLLQRTAGGHRYFYVYDRAGNLVTQRDSTLATGVVVVATYGYDALNRLRSVRQGATVIARYAHDAEGRRVAKKVYSAATGGTVAYTRFVYHGDQVAFETDSGGTILRSYTWGRETDDLVAVRQGTNHFYATQDKLGSVRALSKRDGTHAMTLTYAPWGRAIDSVVTTAVEARYRWTGREYDSETGFYFHRARYYSPLQRRFLQQDPFGYAGSTNVYGYVEGQVLEATDPDGRMFKWKGGGSGSRFYDPGGNDLGLGRGIGSASNIYLDGVPVPQNSMLLGTVAIERITYGGLSQWDLFTQYEKTYTGNIVFETREARAAYRNLKRRAYESGSIVLQEALRRSAHLPVLTITTIGEASGVCSVACTIRGVTGSTIIVSRAVMTVGIRLEVALAHELGHVLPRPLGVIRRTIPGEVSLYDEYLSFYYENEARDIYGCAGRSNDYRQVDPSCR